MELYAFIIIIHRTQHRAFDSIFKPIKSIGKVNLFVCCVDGIASVENNFESFLIVYSKLSLL